jgi:hypothetical protein
MNVLEQTVASVISIDKSAKHATINQLPAAFPTMKLVLQYCAYTFTGATASHPRR